MKEFKSLKKLKLTDREKEVLIGRVRARTNYPVPSPFFKFSFFPHHVFIRAGVLAILVLSLSGATAYASLGSLPGNILYGVKVNVVEKISKLAARDPESRAKMETVQIERRITEFEKLAEEGTLTEAKTKVLERHIDEKFKSFDRNVEEIKKSKEVGAKIHVEKELEQKLEDHKEKIEKIRKEKIENKSALEAVIDRVEEKKAEDEKDRETDLDVLDLEI